MTPFVSWIKAVGCWLYERKHLWLALIVALSVLAFCIHPGTTESTIRLSGLVLQLLGVGTVAWGISETRSLFGLPSMMTVFRLWLGRFPRLKRETISVSMNLTMPGITGSARGYGMDAMGENFTVEDRLNVLEKNLLRTNQRIDQTQREMDDGFRNANISLEQEANKRASEDQNIREKLDATGTGGIHISAIGVLWLFIGATLSTASPEIAKMLQ